MKTGRSVLKFSAESARNGPGARKSLKNGKPENIIFPAPSWVKLITRPPGLNINNNIRKRPA